MPDGHNMHICNGPRLARYSFRISALVFPLGAVADVVREIGDGAADVLGAGGGRAREGRKVGVLDGRGDEARVWRNSSEAYFLDNTGCDCTCEPYFLPLPIGSVTCLIQQPGQEIRES